MGILSGNPTDEPMHYGEVFSTWSYLLVAKGAIAGFQTHVNHAGDMTYKNHFRKPFRVHNRKSNRLNIY